MWLTVWFCCANLLYNYISLVKNILKHFDFTDTYKLFIINDKLTENVFYIDFILIVFVFVVNLFPAIKIEHSYWMIIEICVVLNSYGKNLSNYICSVWR